MGLWFATLAILGLVNLLARPDVLQAFNPLYGLRFLVENKRLAIVAMGAVVLAITGAEALLRWQHTLLYSLLQKLPR